MTCVRPIEAGDRRWSTFVGSHPEATVYHLPEWSEILSGAYRFAPRHLAVEGEQGELRGILPMMSRRGPVSGRNMRSLPAIEIGGPLAANDAARTALLVEACKQARATGCSMLIDSTCGGLDRSVEGLEEVPRPPTWIASVPAAEGEVDAWLSDRSSNLRRGVRRARSRGVTVRLADSDGDLRSFYRLYLGTMRKHRSLPRSWRQLRLASELLGPGTFKLFLAEIDGRPVAGGVFHRFGDTMELLYNGSDDKVLDERPNHALYAHVVGWAAAEGVRRLDYGYAWPGTSLAGFKQQWGAERENRYRYAYPSNGSTAVQAPASARIPRGRLALRVSALWDRAPLALTRVAGAVAYRYL